MNNMEKTVKTRSLAEGNKNGGSQSNLTEAQERVLDLVNKNAQLEEENNKLLEHLRTIEQLRIKYKREQDKTAELLKKTASLEAKVSELNELQLKEKDTPELKAKTKKVAELEAKVRKLTEALGKISGIAEVGKSG